MTKINTEYKTPLFRLKGMIIYWLLWRNF